MSNLTTLSPQTRIEYVDGVAWIVTSDDKVAAHWIEQESAQTWWWAPGADPSSGTWSDGVGSIGTFGPYRIPLLEAWRECYDVREGEPWCVPWKRGIYIGTGALFDSPVNVSAVAHADAAQLCGYSADSLRALIQAVREETTQ